MYFGVSAQAAIKYTTDFVHVHDNTTAEVYDKLIVMIMVVAILST
jgi:hypothetical protein